MVETLPEPKLLRCYIDHEFDPAAPVLCLHWGPEETAEREWELPEGVRLFGPLPERFGISIKRQDQDRFPTRLLWDRTSFYWPALSRAQLLSSSLAVVLAATGTDLWYLLDQPVPPDRRYPHRAA